MNDSGSWDRRTPVAFRGEVFAVKARIRLLRSFDQIHHQYQGYTLVLATDSQPDGVRVAIGPAAQAKFQFRVGDIVSGQGHPVTDPRREWANLYIRSVSSVWSAGVRLSKIGRRTLRVESLHHWKSIGRLDIAMPGSQFSFPTVLQTPAATTAGTAATESASKSKGCRNSAM